MAGGKRGERERCWSRRGCIAAVNLRGRVKLPGSNQQHSCNRGDNEMPVDRAIYSWSTWILHLREGKKKKKWRQNGVPSRVPPSPLRVAPTFNWVRLETCRGFGLAPSFLPSLPFSPSSCIRPSMYRLMSTGVDWSCTQSRGSRGSEFVEISKAWKGNEGTRTII